MLLYRTAARAAEAGFTVERSRFISHIAPVSSREEADAFIAEARKTYKDATHNVPAMVIGGDMHLQWASDDGEPQGTAGAPIVRMLVSEGITNVCVVVTRYFGGIKLGTGGLVRAYTKAAKLALGEAGIRDVREITELDIIIGYSDLSGVMKAASDRDYRISDVVYTDRVGMKISCDTEEAERMKALLTGLTSGSVEIKTEILKST